MLDKSDPTAFGTGIFRIINRSGNIPEFLPATTAPIERMCVRPFRLLNINWKGEALICCNDYHGGVAFGNVRDSTLTQLWNHPVINEYRRRLLVKDRSLPLCSKCDCHAGAYPHNVPHPDGKFATKKQIEQLVNTNRAVL
jgi:MoaA/NifB/PqqE/SkfB family radical SAM enzyme